MYIEIKLQSKAYIEKDKKEGQSTTIDLFI